MALMRVYCGLAASDPAGTHGRTTDWLTAAVVDDAGRLLDVCDIGDDPTGYAELGALLAERSGGAGGVAVAADSDEHQVTLLLAAAGRPLAIVDDETVADYADRFADDESPDEIEAGPAERSAVGLARALQAGALAADEPGRAPRAGRAQAGAGRARAPSRPAGTAPPSRCARCCASCTRPRCAPTPTRPSRSRWPSSTRCPSPACSAPPPPTAAGTPPSPPSWPTTGVADAATISEAITALRVAIAETPRRTGIGKGTTTAVAETIRAGRRRRARLRRRDRRARRAARREGRARTGRAAPMRAVPAAIPRRDASRPHRRPAPPRSGGPVAGRRRRLRCRPRRARPVRSAPSRSASTAPAPPGRSHARPRPASTRRAAVRATGEPDAAHAQPPAPPPSRSPGRRRDHGRRRAPISNAAAAPMPDPRAAYAPMPQAPPQRSPITPVYTGRRTRNRRYAPASSRHAATPVPAGRPQPAPTAQPFQLSQPRAAVRAAAGLELTERLRRRLGTAQRAVRRARRRLSGTAGRTPWTRTRRLAVTRYGSSTGATRCRRRLPRSDATVAGHRDELDDEARLASAIPHQRDGRVAPPWQTRSGAAGRAAALRDDPPALRLAEPEPIGAGAAHLRLVTNSEPLSNGAQRGSGTPRNGSANGGSGSHEDGDLLIFAQMRSAWLSGPTEDRRAAVE